MKLSKISNEDFSARLAAKEPVPGGGGVVALVGSLGVALSSMVTNFSMGKKSLSEFEKKHKELLLRGEDLRIKLLNLVDEDAINFEPLSRAYSLPSSTYEEQVEKKLVLQESLKIAVKGPVKMMDYIYEAIIIHEELVEISSKIIVSDVGVGIQCLKSALYGAHLNVLVNVNLIEDEEYNSVLMRKYDKVLQDGNTKADMIYDKVLKMMR